MNFQDFKTILLDSKKIQKNQNFVDFTIKYQKEQKKPFIFFEEQQKCGYSVPNNKNDFIFC